MFPISKVDQRKENCINKNPRLVVQYFFVFDRILLSCIPCPGKPLDSRDRFVSVNDLCAYLLQRLIKSGVSEDQEFNSGACRTFTLFR